MKITELTLRKLTLVEGDHIVLVAEDGFSMLDQYARGKYKMSITNIQEFANRINRSNEPGTLYPHAPISGMPRKYFRELAATREPSVIIEFQQQLRETLAAIAGLPVQTPMKTVVLDFRVSPASVPEGYVQAAIAVARDFAGTNGFANAAEEFKIVLG